MAGVFNLNTDGRKISGDSASLFDEKSITSSTELGSTSPSLTLSPQPLRLSQDNFNNGFQTSGTLVAGILENLSIWDDTHNQKKKYFCTCGDGITATSYCSVCKDYLCDKCVSAHNRVKITRDHLVQRIDSQTTEPLHRNDHAHLDSRQAGPFQFMCDEHTDSPLDLYCDRCSAPICGRCALVNHNGHTIHFLKNAIDGSKSVLLSLISQSRTKCDLLEKTSGHLLTQVKAVEAQTSDIFREIQTAFRKLANLIEQREKDLIANVRQIQQLKFQDLNNRYEQIRERTENLKKLTEDVKREIEYSNGIDVLKAKERLAEELLVAEQSLTRNTFHNDEKVSFVPPASTFMAMVSQLGEIITQSSSPNPSFPNPLRVTTNDALSSLAVGTRFSHPGEHDNESRQGKRKKGDPLYSNHPLLVKQDFPPPTATLHDNRQAVSRDLREILSGPPGQMVRLTKPRFSFGGMGENDGQLCRPWGVACDRNGNFIVADRSNNRIQIFSPNGTFLRKFGVAGSQPGQFNRPAGLSVDVHDRIVVADKDNHRIQIFSHAGEFIFTFGERGSKNSQFYYPWDIATNSRGLVAVTDTRNHRIQIFDNNGKFIGKYGFEGILWKHFDSPRGIYFANNDTSLVVTDFNNHRLVIVQSDLQSARFLGSEGSQPSQFLRPQGVAIDGHNNYIVADSRNNRLQIFSPSGTIIAILGGTQGSASDEMDRPSGVAVAPDGGVAVVDFGNNRVLVY